jgi:3-hydroxymyristoyl/3-hydroxydecanoyl-(acyl carrier protein) dehydratase
MRFLLIDRICELLPGKSARGIKNISWDDDFLEELFPGIPVFSPIIIAEATAQLVSWIIIEAKEFTVKPVITIVDNYVCNGHVQPGDQVEVTGAIESFSEESALAHGKILLNGYPIIEFNHAVCYLYPLGELDPPEQTRIQYKNLYRPGSTLPQGPASRRTELMREAIPVYPRQWIDKIIDTGGAESITGIKNVTATEDFFNDHFPRKPILPGVIIIDCMVSLARILIERKLAAQGLHLHKPVVKYCKKMKFRTFVQPGDQLVIEARLSDWAPAHSTVRANAVVNGKNAASIIMEFEHLTEEDYKNNYIRS